MKNWKAMAGSLVLAGVLAVPATILAQEDNFEPPMMFKHHGHHGGHFFEHMADELDLTEGQKAQLEANRDATREAHKAQRQQIRELHKQLREAIESGADQATLDSLGSELGKLQVAKMQQMHKQREQFEAILTDEQKAKLEQLKRERKERRMEHRQRWLDKQQDEQ